MIDWHRLGLDHPLVRELDRIVCQQNTVFLKQQRLRRGQSTLGDIESESLSALETASQQLRRERQQVEQEMALLDATTTTSHEVSIAGKDHEISRLQPKLAALEKALGLRPDDLTNAARNLLADQLARNGAQPMESKTRRASG